LKVRIGAREKQRPSLEKTWRHLPLPTVRFRRRAWVEFQRALDPLAPPKALRHPQR